MSNEKIIKFEIVTPEKTVMKENVKKAIIPTKEGELTILPKHTPLVSTLKSGVLELEKEDGTKEVAFVSGGFLEVLRNKVVILADTADRAEDIDMKKVEEVRKKAEEAMSKAEHDDEENFANITASLERELAKTKAVSRWRNIKNLKV